MENNEFRSILTPQEHEVVSTKFLVMFRDSLSERINNGTLSEAAMCGSQSTMVDDLIWCFFDKNRDNVGIRHPTSIMSVSDLRDFINDEVLEVISQHRPEILHKSWNGEWIVSEPDDLTSDNQY